MFNLSFTGNSSSFSTSYQCYSHMFKPGNIREGIEYGGKILMPPSALDHLTRLNVQYPMLFKLTNNRTKMSTHCGVLEFVAEEGKIYVPYWMLQNLSLDEGDVVMVKSVALPVANFAKFEPQSVSFLDISNPKAVLENALRDFACLTVGDIISIKYNDNVYELRVLETKPESAVTIIECDMRVDFAPPLGYVENDTKEKKEDKKKDSNKGENDFLIPKKVSGFQAFCGSGVRLDGRACDPEMMSNQTESLNVISKRGVPNYEYEPGSLTFLRFTNTPSENSAEQAAFKPFEGKGFRLKTATTSAKYPSH